MSDKTISRSADDEGVVEMLNDQGDIEILKGSDSAEEFIQWELNKEIVYQE